MNPGHLTERLEIQSCDTVQVAMGLELHWSVDQVVWCSVVQREVDAKLSYQKQQVQPTHRIVMRDTQDLSFADKRFVWQGRVLRPTGAPLYPRGRRGGMVIINARDITDEGISVSTGGSGSG